MASLKPKPKLLRPIHPNAGCAAAYRKRLDSFVAEMTRSAEYWILAAYKKSPPIAQDASPSVELSRTIAALALRWRRKLNRDAKDIAQRHVEAMQRASNLSLQSALIDSGWAVKFTMTRAMQDALSAQIEENIGLIKSIPEKYFSDLQGVVMRNYSKGRDLEAMHKEIMAKTGATRSRAILISVDQSRKANSIVNRTRAAELGITQAKWLHSTAGNEPRKSHVAANGKVYDIAEGLKIDGEFIHPGELINCRCIQRIILPF